MPNISFFKSASLLPRSHLLLSLQFWTHVGVMSHIPAPETLNLANVLHLLPHGCFLQLWTYVGIMSHISAPETLNLVDVLLFLFHGCFLHFLDNFLHSFLLMLNHLLCHVEKSTLSGVMISSFTNKTCDLSGGAFFPRVNFFKIGTSILVSFIGVPCFSANCTGTRPLTGYRPLRRGDKAGSQQNPGELLPSNLPS